MKMGSMKSLKVFVLVIIVLTVENTKANCKYMTYTFNLQKYTLNFRIQV